jgi:hypothetical protein
MDQVQQENRQDQEEEIILLARQKKLRYQNLQKNKSLIVFKIPNFVYELVNSE